MGLGKKKASWKKDMFFLVRKWSSYVQSSMLNFWWNTLVDSVFFDCNKASAWVSHSQSFSTKSWVKFNEDKHLVYRKQYRKKPGPSKRCQMDAIKQPRVQRSIGGCWKKRWSVFLSYFFLEKPTKYQKIQVDFSRVFPLQITGQPAKAQTNRWDL